jgi:CRISPR-associated protein (TIGR02584 family)
VGFVSERMTDREPVVLVAPLGPYPAPLTELIWALHRQRSMSVVDAFVVVDRRALRYLEEEVLAPGRVLDRLHAVLDREVLDREHLHLVHATLDRGEILDDDLDPTHAGAYLQALWRASRSAVALAGERRVVFGLVGGNRRTLTASTAAFFQLLARPKDLLLDVRVGDPRVEGEPGFFFPEQEQQIIRRGGATIVAKNVPVHLLDVAVPRLAGLIGEESLATFSGAQRASQLAIDAASPPSLRIDLLEGRASVDDTALSLSAAELAWYGYLAAARKNGGEGWVITGQDGHDELRAFLLPLEGREWLAKIQTKPLIDLLAGRSVDDEDLRNLRGKTVQKLKRWCRDHHPRALRLLVPEVEGNRRQRLRIPASRIEIV